MGFDLTAAVKALEAKGLKVDPGKTVLARLEAKGIKASSGSTLREIAEKAGRTPKNANLAAFPFRMVEEELRPIPSKGWAEMIRKVYEVDPMVCPKCGGQMKVVAFITDFGAVDRIIDHLKLRFIAEKPPPSRVFEQVALVAAEPGAEYF